MRFNGFSGVPDGGIPLLVFVHENTRINAAWGAPKPSTIHSRISDEMSSSGSRLSGSFLEMFNGPQNRALHGTYFISFLARIRAPENTGAQDDGMK